MILIIGVVCMGMLQRKTTPNKPKNIILMIGDGMGMGQISATLYSNKNRITLEEFPVVGFQKTHSLDNLITDSAAGATAMCSGHKTYNNAIGVDGDTLPVESVLMKAKYSDMSTGMVVTCALTHATPAAFVAHQPLRVYDEAIAKNIVSARVDALVGGGKKYFEERETDNADLLEILEEKGYYISDNRETPLANVRLSGVKKWVHFTASEHPPKRSQGRTYFPDAVKKSIRFLDKKNKGFFLLAEGSQIDWGGHNKNANWVIDEVEDFDRGVAKALEFAKKDKETLVIVTADHETGGMSIQPGSKMNKLDIAFTTNGHTADMVPVFAYGPGAEAFSGIYDNTAIHYKIMQLMGWK